MLDRRKLREDGRTNLLTRFFLSLSPAFLLTKSTSNSVRLLDSTLLEREASEKLKKLQQSVRIGGKGTPRRRTKKVHKSSGTDDKKLQTSLKKLNVQPIQAIEEVNMFKEDGNVIHFAAPKVHASVPSNTFAIYGNGEDKELTELVPGILNQLGPDSLASLRRLAESYQSMQKKEGAEGGKKDGEGADDDDEIPDLVEGENFEGKVE
ncbi:Nascent polypeptide-associated complex subunit beta [Endocarpon pusillum]|uniref:Nascent polypeptide-associated complex subunit beta n=1 Tax=Endocarpon pusillum TaxID=364733 RepID=A0A8H7E6P9_9EURO|nr:Nascent polypeptide-associated complex subunit beta [Endocarpon pusillum]